MKVGDFIFCSINGRRPCFKYVRGFVGKDYVVLSSSRSKQTLPSDCVWLQLVRVIASSSLLFDL